MRSPFARQSVPVMRGWFDSGSSRARCWHCWRRIGLADGNATASRIARDLSGRFPARGRYASGLAGGDVCLCSRAPREPGVRHGSRISSAARRGSDMLGEGAASTPAVTRTAAARVRTMFMAGQVAVACILLVGASLLVRSFTALVAVDRGFDPRGLLTMRVPQPPKTTFAQRMTLLERLQPRLARLPGVTDVAFGNALPFVTVGGYRGMTMALPRDPLTKVDVQAAMRCENRVFRAMRLRILQGDH